MNNSDLYSKTKPIKLFLKAAIPGGISMLVSSLYMVFDSIFVGKFVGTTAFAALGLAMPLVIINFALADLIGVGSSILISIFLGQGEDKKANNYFTCATLMIIMTGILMGLIMFFASPFFMELMGADGELAKLGVTYIRIYAVFSPLITMMFAIDNYLRISGKLKTSMLINIIQSLGTIIVESIFILVFKWGIVGAALGASLSMLVGVIIGISLFVSGKLQLKYVKPKFNKALILGIIKNGLPAFLTNVSGRVFSIIMNIMLLKMSGEGAVAVYGILMTVGGIVEQLLYGVLDSLQPAIGYNYGAKKFDRVKQIEKYCLITGAIISIAWGIVIYCIPGILAIPFLKDVSLLGMVKHALRILSFAYLVKWISHAIQSFLLAIDRAISAMIISLALAFFFPVILIAVLYPLKLNGLWLNYTVTCVLTAILAIVILFLLRKKLFVAKGTNSEE